MLTCAKVCSSGRDDLQSPHLTNAVNGTGRHSVRFCRREAGTGSPGHVAVQRMVAREAWGSSTTRSPRFSTLLAGSANQQKAA